MVKINKEKSWNEFGEQMERNSKENRKIFYKTLKTLRQEEMNQNTTMKSKGGNQLIGEKQIMNLWRQ